MISLVDAKSYNSIYIAPEVIQAIIPSGSTAEILIKGGRIVRVRWGLHESISVSEELRKARDTKRTREE